MATANFGWPGSFKTSTDSARRAVVSLQTDLTHCDTIGDQRLTPTERAAYILREPFDYAYRDIANVLRLAEANARQVVTRARQHIASGRTTAASSTEQQRLLEAFIAAAQDADVASLEHFFTSDVVSTSDGLVRAA